MRALTQGVDAVRKFNATECTAETQLELRHLQNLELARQQELQRREEEREKLLAAAHAQEQGESAHLGTSPEAAGTIEPSPKRRRTTVSDVDLRNNQVDIVLILAFASIRRSTMRRWTGNFAKRAVIIFRLAVLVCD